MFYFGGAVNWALPWWVAILLLIPFAAFVVLGIALLSDFFKSVKHTRDINNSNNTAHHSSASGQAVVIYPISAQQTSSPSIGNTPISTDSHTIDPPKTTKQNVPLSLSGDLTRNYVICLIIDAILAALIATLFVYFYSSGLWNQAKFIETVQQTAIVTMALRILVRALFGRTIGNLVIRSPKANSTLRVKLSGLDIVVLLIAYNISSLLSTSV